MLALFVHSDGKVLSRDEILNRVWGRKTQVNVSSVDNVVARVRSKIRLLDKEQSLIETVRGKGYRWIGAPSSMGNPSSVPCAIQSPG